MNLDKAFSLFEENNYDEAMKEFIAQFAMADSEEDKGYIFNIIYENFIKPNDVEFRDSYNKNVQYFKDNDLLNGIAPIPYQELPLFLIPVSDDKYYLWNRFSNSFWGDEALDLEFLRNLKKSSEKLFDSILLDGFADMRAVSAELCAKSYANNYLVFSDDFMAAIFWAFMMVPGFATDVLPQVRVFGSTDDLKCFLIESGNYVPRTVKVAGENDYKGFFEAVHEKRLESEKKAKPILSICIPTRGRGEKALRNVNRLRELLYDEEIEIVVADNGTEGEDENYKKIEMMPGEDSRVKYKKFPPDTFCSSIENVLRLSSGSFAVLCSDEDNMDLNALGDALQFIYEHKKKGAILFRLRSSSGQILYDDYNDTTDVFDSVISSFSVNYVTGICYNMDRLRENDFGEAIISKYHKQNYYYDIYPHNVFFLFLAKNYEMGGNGTILFNKKDDNKEEAKVFTENINTDRFLYQKLESRFAHLDAQVRLVLDLGLTDDISIAVLVELQERVYKLLYGSYYLHYGHMSSQRSWEECCEEIYRNNLAMWNRDELKKLCHGDMHERIVKVLIKYRDIHMAEKPNKWNG
ncbi:glycosyltransferase [Butyrivibrio sp. INlla16]|uniref:glycosyltransferase n=1 Tax=Butyrivibrio sp. INlla16 TaxID=1520807 RepID=UPI000884EDC8|nr:glycosyltransferase [Butyrivibrio sp. INlla16]SDB60233.1 Glycosyl transferase family 2 [Butyrivibrio sp. INlla16]